MIFLAIAAQLTPSLFSASILRKYMGLYLAMELCNKSEPQENRQKERQLVEEAAKGTYLSTSSVIRIKRSRTILLSNGKLSTRRFN